MNSLLLRKRERENRKLSVAEDTGVSNIFQVVLAARIMESLSGAVKNPSSTRMEAIFLPEDWGYLS